MKLIAAVLVTAFSFCVLGSAQSVSAAGVKVNAGGTSINILWGLFSLTFGDDDSASEDTSAAWKDVEGSLARNQAQTQAAIDAGQWDAVEVLGGLGAVLGGIKSELAGA